LKESEKTQKDYFSFEIIDTLKIKKVGYPLRILDYNKKRREFLLGEIKPYFDTIFVSDNNGNVLKRFYFKGGSEKEAGNIIFSIGYYKDSTIIVNSERGFYLFDLDGKYINSISEKTPIRGPGTEDFKILSLNSENDQSIALSLKMSKDYKGANF